MPPVLRHQVPKREEWAGKAPVLRRKGATDAAHFQRPSSCPKILARDRCEAQDEKRDLRRQRLIKVFFLLFFLIFELRNYFLILKVVCSHMGTTFKIQAHDFFPHYFFFNGYNFNFFPTLCFQIWIPFLGSPIPWILSDVNL